MRHKTVISVGIPAYNEEVSITSLLKSILKQKNSNFNLNEIIVISDGSNDKTVLKARSFKNKNIKVLNYKKRQGKSARINQILKIFNSEVLILIDADVTIRNTSLFSTIVNVTNLKKSGVVCLNTQPLSARGFFESCINFSVYIQEEIRKKWNKGSNYLSFKGCFLVLDRDFAKSLKLPKNLINNDAFIYFSARNKGYIPDYLSGLKVYYKSPSTFSDHLKQSLRFQKSRDELIAYFKKTETLNYKIPRRVIVSTIIKFFFKNPLLFSTYFLINLITRIFEKNGINSKWEIAASTKGN